VLNAVKLGANRFDRPKKDLFGEGLATQAKCTLQTQSAHAILLAGYKPHRKKPRAQRLAVSWNTVPAVSDVLPSQALHRNTPRAVTQGSPATPQRSQTKPLGQHKRRI